MTPTREILFLCNKGVTFLIIGSLLFVHNVVSQTTPIIKTPTLKKDYLPPKPKFKDSAILHPNLKTDSLSGSWKNQREGFSRSMFESNHVNSYGIIGAEGYHTNFQNPRVLNQPTYLRLNLNSGFSLLGLPFIADGYYTTEKRTLYNSNHFTVRFDRDAFLKGLTDAWQKKKREAGNELTKHKNELQIMDVSADQLKKSSSGLIQKQQFAQVNFQTAAQGYIEKYRTELTKKLEDSLQSLYRSGKDSTNRWQKYQAQKFRDSSRLESLKRDTQRIHESINSLRQKQEELQQKKSSLDSSISLDTALIGKYQRMLDSPESAAQQWLQENNFPKPLQVLASIKDFQTGNVQPYLNDLSLAGVGFRGGNFAAGFGKMEIRIAGGRGIPLDLYNYDRSNNKYTRNFGGVTVKFRLPGSVKAQLFVHHISDPVDQMNRMQKVAILNQVAGINISMSPRGWFDLESNMAGSRYQVLNNLVKSTNYKGMSELSGTDILKSRGAANVNLKRKISKNLEASASYKYVGPMFKNLGNPFMRSNFIEYQGRITSQFWKQQLKITGFYKDLHDNPMHLIEVTNRTKGYGANLQTRFNNKKLPNFNVGISPYEQGNNHPDSLFRVNSRYSIITAGLSYRINKRFIKYNFLAYGTRSQMQFSDTLRATVQTITISQDLYLGHHWNLGATGTLMRTKPGVDSSQANIWQGRVSWTGKHGSSLGISAQYSQYLNGAYRKGLAINCSIKASKHFRLSLRTGYDHYYRLWGMGDRESFWGLCRLEVIW